MSYVVRMPQMGLEMERGEVVAWVFDEGDAVEEGDVIAVVESEKASNDVEAREDGVLRRIAVPVGGVVEPGEAIGIVAGADEDVSDLESELPDGEASAGESADDAAADESGQSSDDGSTGDATAAQSTSTAPDRSAADVRATPGAKRLAEERGLDLAAVEGTGPQGTVTEDDVDDHAGGDAPGDAAGTGGDATTTVRATPGAKRLAEERGLDLAAVEGTGPQGTVTEDDVDKHGEGASATGTATQTVREVRELSGIQRTVRDRMSESHRNAPHVTLNRSFDAGTMQDVREAAAAAGVEVSLTDLLVRGAGAQLAARPEFNALYEDGEHRLIEEVNVGVAVDVEDGLLTPVVPNVAEKSVEAVSEVRTARTEKALSGDFSMDDLSGGTFTVSNLGMFGVDSFDPIINPPEVAILGVGRVRPDGTMTLSLSFDHRVVNGADAARFLDALVEDLTDLPTLVGYFEADVLGE